MTPQEKHEKMYRDLAVATEIKKQFGPMFGAMTGASKFVAIDSGLQFCIGEGAKNDINKVVVILSADDTYQMKFYAIDFNGYSDTPYSYTSEHSGIYFDMLQDIFTEETGFRTTL